MRSRPAVVAALASPAALRVVSGAATALARAGGGQDYDPGGGEGSDDGAGAIVWLLFRLIIWAFSVSPLLGLALLGAIAFAAFALRNRLPGVRTARAVRTLDRSRFVPPGGAEQALQALRAKDPALDADRLLERVKTAFKRAQEAWSAGDLRPLRPFVTDAVFTRFETLLELDRRRGRRNVVGDLAIEEAQVVAALAGPDYDEIAVRITARARDTGVPAAASAEEALAAMARAPLTRFVEVWSFLRRSGAATRAGNGSLEGSCPSCGAPLALAETTACAHCGSLVASGTHDWVLAEVTQEAAWSGASAGAVAGLDALKRRDPGVSRQEIEDRASLVFWRWIEARVTGNASFLRKLATPELPDRLAAGLSAPEDLDRLAVGSADLVLVEAGVARAGAAPADASGKVDRAHVRVSWSAAPASGGPGSPRTHLLVLVRTAAARSSGRGLASASCRQCGAPLSATDLPTCDYCGADLAAGDGDFVLERIATSVEWSQERAREAAMARALSAPVAGAGGEAVLETGATGDDDSRVTDAFLPDPRVPLERERLVHALVLAAAADGRYARGEERLLRATAKRFAVDAEKLRGWMEAAIARSPLQGVAPDENENAIAIARPALAQTTLSGPLLVRSLAAAALVDGRVDRRERALLRRVGAHAGLDAIAVDALITRELERIHSRRPPASQF